MVSPFLGVLLSVEAFGMLIMRGAKVSGDFWRLVVTNSHASRLREGSCTPSRAN